MKFKATKNGFIVCYRTSEPEFTWVDAKNEAIEQLRKYKDSKVYKDYLLRSQMIAMLEKENETVKNRVELLELVIASILDNETQIVNKKGDK